MHSYAFFVSIIVLIIAIVALRAARIYIERKKFKGGNAILILCAVSIGFLMFVSYIFSAIPLEYFSENLIKRQVANTKVLNVTTEPLLSLKENPIGILLKYSIIFPNNGEADLSSMVRIRTEEKYNSDGIFMASFDNQVETMDGKIDYVYPSSPDYLFKYKRGEKYYFTIRVFPTFIRVSPDGLKYCARRLTNKKMDYIKGSQNSEYTIKIYKTNTGLEYDDEQLFKLTKKLYSVKEFYDNLIKEDIPECIEGDRTLDWTPIKDQTILLK
jgi:hypothetical protein